MKQVIIFFSILQLKLLKFLLASLKLGSGTALPGLIVEKYIPWLFTHFTDQLDQVILITGTNGKTTTKAILSEILNQTEIKHLSNHSGSNMKRGLLSAFLANSSLTGSLGAKTALFEIEEATLPKLIKHFKPQILIVTNLFRDQLDAYGEVNKTREYIADAIQSSPTTKLILNADDPMVATLSELTAAETKYFSLPDENHKEFKYEESKSQTSTNKQIVKAENIQINQDLSSTFTAENQEFTFQSPGIFNIYNALAAIQCANLLKINRKHIATAFKEYTPTFGRGEIISYKKAGRQIRFRILLIKNPAGFTLTLNLLSKIKSKNSKILLILNDKIADGRDVSWIWDAEVEKLADISPELIVASGNRANDMALRMRYALDDTDLIIRRDIKSAINKITQEAKDGETIFVLPTYTAMNEFRKILGKRF